MKTEYFNGTIIHGFTANALPCMRITDHSAIIFDFNKLGKERIVIQREERNDKGDIEIRIEKGDILVEMINENIPTETEGAHTFTDLRDVIKSLYPSVKWNLSVNLNQMLASIIMASINNLVSFNEEKIDAQIAMLVPSSHFAGTEYKEYVWKVAQKNILVFAGRCIACLEATYIGDTVPLYSVITGYPGEYSLECKRYYEYVKDGMQREDFNDKIVFENYIWSDYRD